MAGSRVSRLAILPPQAEIDLLLRRIRPLDDRRALARDLHARIRVHLARTKKLTTVSPDSLLAGSYARDVSTHRLKDVDVIVLVDPGYRELGIARVLSDLAAAADGLVLRHRVATVRKRAQRRSVGLTFEDDEFHIELVPAIAAMRSRWVTTYDSGGKGAAAVFARSERNVRSSPTFA